MNELSFPAVDDNACLSIISIACTSQGLSYGTDGYIYETTGRYGKSKVRRIDPETFEVQQSKDIPTKFFGEGSTHFTDKDGNSRLIQITWKSSQGFIYDADTLDEVSSFEYTTTAPGNEGWGITYDEDKQEFIVSDGSHNLFFWDRDTLEEKRRVVVRRLNGKKQKELNELEMIHGLVCCNIWFSDEIICVDPETGNAVKEYDFSVLKSEVWSQADVLNGIAKGDDHILITGKLWDKMFVVQLNDAWW